MFLFLFSSSKQLVVLHISNCERFLIDYNIIMLKFSVGFSTSFSLTRSQFFEN